MNIEIKKLDKSDYKKVIQYAIKGMHFDMYMDNKLELSLYGRYFWYLELTNATQVIAAYLDDELAGVLLADIKGEDKLYRYFWKKLYVKMFEWVQRTFFKDSVGIYDKVNKELLDIYMVNNKPDGEIKFLAANPDIKVKGIGTYLLNEFEKRNKGKEVYLFTDDQCTYQFYEHRDFERIGKKDIELDLKKKKVSLKCLLYRKKIK
ncbi:MAG: GNAT family N-acetyltransferase [Thomasclavelia sp.]|uniref:GNAT family N-acetyltransferase n=1 Tax=Thomasclavelia sp. TaxID=3025757 RepID=UPI0039A351AE